MRQEGTIQLILSLKLPSADICECFPESTVELQWLMARLPRMFRTRSLVPWEYYLESLQLVFEL